AGDGFDAADSGGDGGFGIDPEEADLAGGAGVGAGAEFHRIAVERGAAVAVDVPADLHDADGLAVFVAEDLHDVGAPAHFGVGHFDPRDAGIFHDALVHEPLD